MFRQLMLALAAATGLALATSAIAGDRGGGHFAGPVDTVIYVDGVVQDIDYVRGLILLQIRDRTVIVLQVVESTRIIIGPEPRPFEKVLAGDFLYAAAYGNGEVIKLHVVRP